MLTTCGRPQGGGGPVHVDACGQGRSKPDFFVDVINGWPLICWLRTKTLTIGSQGQAEQASW